MDVRDLPFATNFHQASPMLEILVVMAVIAIGLAKARRRRKYRRYLKGAIEEDFALSTLAANTLLSDVVGDVVTEKAWLSSVRAVWSLKNKTIGQGPILVGVAHSDYTDAEIEQWVEQLTSWDQGDQISQEIAKRKIRRIGTFGEAGDSLSVDVLNEGRPITTKCGWMLITGQTVRLWAYNSGNAALSTTSPTVTVSGHANLWPA